MTIGGIDSVMARIAQIQATFTVSVPTVVKTTAASTAATTAAAASTLQSEAAAAAISADPAMDTTADTTAATSFADTLASATSATASGGVTGDEVVASAKKYLGIPYVWGGTTTAGLDCSGLVQKAYGDLGISLPRTAAEQARTGTPVASLAQAQPGDILAFGSPAHHVAIYLGNNQMIAAPQTGEDVKIQSVYETPTTIRREVGTASSVSAVPVSTAVPSASLSTGVAQYSGLFAADEAKYQLPAGMLAAVAQTESGGNAGAVSPAGAQGLMQLMPSTAKGLGVDPWVPAQAVDGAAKMLSGYLTKFGSVPLALAAYNAGPGAVEQYGGIPPYTETQNYVTKITGLMSGGV